MEIYNRFLFAFLSVHTSWQSNVIAYNIMKNHYHKDYKKTKELLIQSKVGMYNHRSEYITEFTKNYLEHPEYYLKRDKESWQEFANRLIKNIKGLGFAKARFAIELIYPNEAEIVVVDTHIIQWAKQNPNKMNNTLYKKIEQGFLNHSKQHAIHPIEMRWKYWDQKQGYKDCRYWSYCLER